MTTAAALHPKDNQQLPTVFTSNIRVAQLDQRIASRMHDPALHAQIITIQAADYRRRKAEPIA